MVTAEDVKLNEERYLLKDFKGTTRKKLSPTRPSSRGVPLVYTSIFLEQILTLVDKIVHYMFQLLNYFFFLIGALHFV